MSDPNDTERADEHREATLDDVIEELKLARVKNKDWWDRVGPIFTGLSTLVLGLAGLLFTYTYNKTQSAINERQKVQDQETQQHQARVAEMEALQKFIPDLTAGEEKRERYALLFITTLGSKGLAARFADRLMASGAPAKEAKSAPTVTGTPAGEPRPADSQRRKKSGWVYLGHYIKEDRRWETRYFEFGDTADPSKFASTLTVWDRTGAVNVRTDMPSPAGEFQRVQDVLKPPSQVTVRSVREWYSTGYIWAEVEYEI